MPQVDLLTLVLGALLLGGIAQIVFLVGEVERRRADWRLGEQRLTWRPIWMLDVMVVLAVLLVASLAGGAWLKATGYDPEDLTDLRPFVVQFLGFQLLVVVATAVHLRRRGISWRDAFSDPSVPARHWIGYTARLWLALFPLMLMVSAVTTWVLHALGIPPQVQDVLEKLHGIDSPFLLAGAVFFAVVGAPVSEELLFRGILLPAMSKWIGVPAAIVVNSLLFAWIHLEWQQAPALFVLSIVLCLAVLRTRRLESAMLLHAVFNLFMITLSLRLDHAPPG